MVYRIKIVFILMYNFDDFQNSMIENIENWFVDWFDSDHYHLLYNHRDYAEAEQFITNLFDQLKLEHSKKILDLACGKGRHAIQVHELGYDVLGIDLSEESIEHANRFSEEGLKFQKADMRYIGLSGEVDIVLNLFTSFGYFLKEGDNLKVLKSISEALRPEGYLVLDYLNVSKVLKTLPQENLIKRGELNFQIKKTNEDGFIVKHIEFVDKGETFHYEEYVKQIDLGLFETYFEKVNMKIIKTYGDYDLNPFNPEKSDRLIMLVKKMNTK